MKHQYSLLAVLAVSAFAVGCGQSEKPTTEDREATAKQLEKIRTETKQAAQDIKEYAYDELKDKFRQARQWLSEKIAP